MERLKREATPLSTYRMKFTVVMPLVKLQLSNENCLFLDNLNK